MDVHQECSQAVDLILSESVKKKTLDNITVVMISFTNFQKPALQDQYFLTEREQNKIEYREHQRQVMTEAMNSAATSRQPSEDSQKSKLTLSPGQLTQRSNKMNYFVLSKSKQSKINPTEIDKQSQNEQNKSKLSKVLQKYESRIQTQSNLNQNIVEIQQKTLLFKKSIDEQKSKNLYQILKQKQLVENTNNHYNKSSMFDVQDKSKDQQVKQTLHLKNYQAINSARSTNSNHSSARDYEANANQNSSPLKRQSRDPNHGAEKGVMFSPKSNGSASSSNSHYNTKISGQGPLKIQRQHSDRLIYSNPQKYEKYAQNVYQTSKQQYSTNSQQNSDKLRTSK
eukprot:403346236